jgi:pimeloyl-ACP methyl ester carboxylesterase
VLPEGYDSAFRYPVLWLLHGHGGDETDWLRETELTRDFYVDSQVDSASRYEDFVVRDLHDDVVRRYAVDTLREGIAGLSMGGYGAPMLALRHPRRSRFAGVLSGALWVPSPLEREDTLGVGLLPAVDSAFGPEPNPHRRAHDLVPGGHDWRIWGGALPSLLARFWIEVTAPQHRPPR